MEFVRHLFVAAIVVGWLASVAAFARMVYCAIRMSQDLKNGVSGHGGAFPLMVDDGELWTEEGRYFRDQFQKYLALFFLLVAVLMAAMYLNHRYWP